MERLVLPVLPRARRPSLAGLGATAPRKQARAPGAAACRVVPPRQWSDHVDVAGRRRQCRPVCAVAPVETPRTEEAVTPAAGKQEERFEWLDQWYPVAPVCDLDPRAPHGKTVLGLAVVAWFDRSAAAGDGDGEWRVFDDACPHRLAPLSEGRIDGKGRLQCVYHGWCFDGRGACQFIPQAPALGPPVHKNSKASAVAYPSVVQNGILWFYPRSEAEHADVLQRKRPPYIPEIDDPSFVTVYGIRDLLYGYDVLVENLMDPAHAPYAHKGIFPGMPVREDPGRYVVLVPLPTSVEIDREGGAPIKMKITEAGIDGFLSEQDFFFFVRKEMGFFRFAAPCLVHGSPTATHDPNAKQAKITVVFLCVPVAPGRSRVIWAFPRNVGVWLHNIIPRWYYHIGQMAILDSDIYLLHLEERKFAEVGLDNWQKACYVPTSSDGNVVAFRNWFRKYTKCQVGWARPTAADHHQLPPTPTKDKVMDRYWSHVAQCTSCSAALKGMRAAEAALQVASVAAVGLLAVFAGKGTVLASVAHRAAVVAAAVLCFAASRWLAGFIDRNFYFQDYVHAHKQQVTRSEKDFSRMGRLEDTFLRVKENSD